MSTAPVVRFAAALDSEVSMKAVYVCPFYKHTPNRSESARLGRLPVAVAQTLFGPGMAWSRDGTVVASCTSLAYSPEWRLRRYGVICVIPHYQAYEGSSYPDFIVIILG